MLAPGLLLSNRYRLEALLGEGGMGYVWSAADEWLPRRVAVKVLKPAPGADIDAEQRRTERRRLLREAQTATAVPHPGVVKVLDVNPEGDEPYLVMELLEGRSLRQHLDSAGKPSCATACALLAQVASAVGAAHELDIVHRDLKPENIFLTGKAPVSAATRVKVLDFGIAKLLDRAGGAAAPLTRAGLLVGSPPYMSPEQAFQEPDIDHRTDVWSLGIVLYECLSGVRPTEAENTGQVIKIITKDGVEPIEKVMPGVPPELAALLGRMLEQEPAKRLADMREVRAVLERHAGAEAPPPTHTPSPLDSLQGFVLPEGAARTSPARPAPEPVPPPPAPRRRSGLILAAAAGMISLSMVGVWVAQSGPAESSPRDTADPASSASQSAQAVTEPSAPAPPPPAPPTESATAAPPPEPSGAPSPQLPSTTSPPPPPVFPQVPARVEGPSETARPTGPVPTVTEAGTTVPTEVRSASSSAVDDEFQDRTNRARRTSSASAPAGASSTPPGAP